MNWGKATVLVFHGVNDFTYKQTNKKAEFSAKKDFAADGFLFFFPLPQLCITCKIQFRTSARWNLRRGWSSALILEHLFVLLLKQYCRQEKHLLRNFRGLTEHLLKLMLCQFAGEQVFCNHAEASVSQSWF